MYEAYCGPRPWTRRAQRWEETGGSAYAPVPVDVMEEGEEFIVAVSLPGVEQNEIELHIDGETIRIRAERKDPERKGEVLLKERYAGRLGRTLTLPVAMDAEKAEAVFENGVLTIRIPKAEAIRAKSIPIHAK